MNRFLSAIQGKEKISIIAEIKLASPTNGKFGKHPVPNLVKAYNQAGASAISVVTAGGTGTSLASKFQGSLQLLQQVKSLTQLPVLRKDFITDKKEVSVTASAGASALLLIANILSTEKLDQLIQACLHHKLAPLVELHDLADLQKLQSLKIQPGQIAIGINNRDLKTLKTNVNHALQLIEKIDPNHVIIAESAFQSHEQLKPYQGKIDAALIGTSLLTSENPQQKLTSFIQPII